MHIGVFAQTYTGEREKIMGERSGGGFTPYVASFPKQKKGEGFRRGTSKQSSNRRQLQA